MAACIAYEMRRQREARGLSQDQLAKELYSTRATIQAYEARRNRPDEDFCARLDAFFGTGLLFQALWFHAQKQHLKQWLEQYLELETVARQIRIFQPLNIPGLLQTEAYARSALEAGYVEEVEAHAQSRMRRQTIIHREDDPPFLWVVLDEVALLRPVGGAAVMKDQLAHLVEASRLPKVSIQLVPLAAGAYQGQDGGFLVLQLPGRNVAFAEAQIGGRLIEDPAEVSSLGVTHDRIRGKALPEDDSRILITRLMENMR